MTKARLVWYLNEAAKLLLGLVLLVLLALAGIAVQRWQLTQRNGTRRPPPKLIIEPEDGKKP